MVRSHPSRRTHAPRAPPHPLPCLSAPCPPRLRETHDELLRQSAVLSHFRQHDAVHVCRYAADADGNLAAV